MKHEHDIEQILANTPVPTVAAGPHRDRLKSELLALPRETTLFHTLLLVLRRNAAFAGGAIILLAAGAWGGEKLYRSIFETVVEVESAAVAGRDSAAAALTDPSSAVARQLADFRELAELNPQGFKIVSIHANDRAALAVTTEINGDHGRHGPLVMKLIKRDGTWLLNDVDVETAASAKDELARFLKRHPDAVESPVKPEVD